MGQNEAKTSTDVLNALYAELDKVYLSKDWRSDPRPTCAKW